MRLNYKKNYENKIQIQKYQIQIPWKSWLTTKFKYKKVYPLNCSELTMQNDREDITIHLHVLFITFNIKRQFGKCKQYEQLDCLIKKQC